MKSYLPLARLTIYHDYFLDNGILKFNQMQDEVAKQKQLDNYAVSDFLTVIPSPDTLRLFKNYRIIMISNSNGFELAVSADNDWPIIGLSPDLTLLFLLKIKDPDFISYTETVTENEASFLFANYRPSTEVTSFSVMKVKPLSSPDEAYIDNSFRMNNTTRENFSQLFSSDQLTGSIGFVSLKMGVANNEPGITLITSQGNLVATLPEFIFQFRNKKYFWVYKKWSESVCRSAIQYPLVKNGFVLLNPQEDLLPAQSPVQGMKYPNPSVFNFSREIIEGNEEVCSVIYL